ncbi:hypothetical protein CLRAG_40000 [Clostridium ragsdalei P11]|uniref:Uncharacterized protein n=1 Tax=Clostridium ragsdalei P11 TaxID=1353534 RepID=A0A1A6AI92_9CLOT|nr:hypothetical protein CLRAG_40000 [Clostridium ragsdalei P11]
MEFYQVELIGELMEPYMHGKIRLIRTRSKSVNIAIGAAVAITVPVVIAVGYLRK